jgi:Tol biopolymer transport system component
MIRPLLTILAVSLVISGCDTPWPENTFAEEVSAKSSVVEDTTPRVRRILAKAEDYASPSPDGRYMTFVDWSTGDVAMMDVATEESRRVTDKGTWTENGSWAEEPLFSPDGQSIVYAYGNTRAGIPFRYEIRTIPASGGESSLLYRFDTPEGWAQPVDWGTPGILLEIWTPITGLAGLALISADGGEPRMLHQLAIDGPHPHEATFSPDGQWIAYRLAGQLYLIRPDGSNRTVLDVSAGALMGWTADGSALILHSDIDGTTAIWSVSVENGRRVGEPVLVKVGPPALTPAGRAGSRYFYTVAVDVPRLFQSSFDLEEGRTLTTPTQVTSVMDGAVLWPSWSPDGTLLAYVHSEPDPAKRIMVRSVRDAEVLEVATLERAQHVRSLKWDASGSQLYYSVKYIGEETDLILERVEVDTGERETFQLSGSLIVAVPGERKAVIFREPRDDEGRATTGGLFLHDLKTGREVLLRSGGGWIRQTGDLAVSPDERTIAWVESSEDNRSTFLMAIPLEGGEARVIAQKSYPQHLETGLMSLRWSPNGGTIFAVSGTSDSDLPHVLNAIQVNGGATANTIELPDGLFHSINPDGSGLVFVKGDFKNEMWVLEGLD